MKRYLRLMLGKKSIYAAECFANHYIGVHFDINEDLTGKLPDDWRTFNKEFIPKFIDIHPEKSKVAAGLACGAVWTVAKGLCEGDIVLCPNGEGRYHIGEITGGYQFHPNTNLPHRRAVRWYDQKIDRSDMSSGLKNSTGSAGTVSAVDCYSEEIDLLIVGAKQSVIYSTDEIIEDPAIFVLEKHLEDFLVANWSQTQLGQEYDIFQEDGEINGQQYPTDTGYMDILAISKDKSKLLVVELKKGRASDAVVGQIQRYMGYVKEELAEENQSVQGVIIALEDDIRIKRALVVAPNIKFLKYQINFKLIG